MSDVLSIVLSTWDDVDAHFPVLLRALGADSDTGKKLLAVKSDVDAVKREFLTHATTAADVVKKVEVAFAFVAPFLPPPIGEAVQIALRVIETSVSPTLIDVVVEPTRPGAPPKTIDGQEG